jgi:hypothetical protein
MSLSIVQPNSMSETAEGSVLAERLDELQETNSRLQLLVCELLMKNQQLRFQRDDEQMILNVTTDELTSCGVLCRPSRSEPSLLRRQSLTQTDSMPWRKEICARY